MTDLFQTSSNNSTIALKETTDFLTYFYSTSINVPYMIVISIINGVSCPLLAYLCVFTRQRVEIEHPVYAILFQNACVASVISLSNFIASIISTLVFHSAAIVFIVYVVYFYATFTAICWMNICYLRYHNINQAYGKNPFILGHYVTL